MREIHGRAYIVLYIYVYIKRLLFNNSYRCQIFLNLNWNYLLRMTNLVERTITFLYFSIIYDTKLIVLLKINVRVPFREHFSFLHTPCKFICNFIETLVHFF